MNLQKGHSGGGRLVASPMIKSAKNAKRKKRISAIRIAYIPQWGIFQTYRVRLTKSPSSFFMYNFISS